MQSKNHSKPMLNRMVVMKIKGEKAPVSNLQFNQASIEINKGNHEQLTLSVTPSNTPVSVFSSDENILSVSLAGVHTYKLTAKKEGHCSLQAITENGEFKALCKGTVFPSTIPAPWTFNEIEDNKASVNYHSGVFTIEAGGRDIWGGSDQFGFLNREVAGNQAISAQILTQTDPDPWAKTGLMFRESLEANSSFVMLCMTPGNGISLQWRKNRGRACRKRDFGKAELPIFFKLSREASTFTAHKSIDGKKWELLGDVTLADFNNEKYLIGLEVTSHSSHLLNRSEFDKVQVEPVKIK